MRAISADLFPDELPMWGLLVGTTAFDNAHRSEGAAIEAAANRGPLLVHRAAPFPQVNAGPVRALLEHQFAIGVALGEQVGQAPPVALRVHGDPRVIAARRTPAARNRPGVPAPPGREEVLSRAAHCARCLAHEFWISIMRNCLANNIVFWKKPPSVRRRLLYNLVSVYLSFIES
jgi:hypothetical protein